jgi:protein-disulfide isomerase
VAQTRRKQATQGANLKPFYILLGVIAVAGIAWITLSATRGGGGRSAAVRPVDLAGLQDAQSLLGAARGVTAGPADARVQILEFSDFTCPACRVFATQVAPRIKAEFVETGRVRFVYHDFPLGGEAQHRWGFLAARAARCAEEQGRFWEYHDVLFARQSEWPYTRTAPTRELGDYATAIGLDGGAFSSCLNSDRHADVVTANRVLGDNLGVRGTPTVYIGGRAVDRWSDWENVRSLILRELGEAQ